MSSITNNQKREFIKYFLQNYALQDNVCNWILQFLHDSEAHLSHIHFTDNVRGQKNAMIMSATCEIDDPPFKGTIQGEMTYDPEKMFTVLKFNEDTPFYIDLRFSNRMAEDKFIMILEENNKMRAVRLGAKDRVALDALLNHSIESNRKNLVMILIDEALKTGNKEKFLELSQTYKEMVDNEKIH